MTCVQKTDPSLDVTGMWLFTRAILEDRTIDVFNHGKMQRDPRDQAQLRILKLVTDEPGISQRQLAERLDISLGKTNYLLKALLEKGLIKADNFRRSANKLGYVYLLTPEGLKAKLSLTHAYLARKEVEYLALKSEIEAMRAELAAQG